MQPNFPGQNQPQSPAMTVQCPHCSAQLSASPSAAGQVSSCTHCGGKFQLPVPTAQIPRTPEQSIRKEIADKKLAAGLCGILIGGFGVHKFILGYNNAGIIMLSVSLAGTFLGACLVIPLLIPVALQVIGLVEGILYLTKDDDEFYQTYVARKREWV